MVAIMCGPGKGGPGKTTTSINLGAALALEFLRERLAGVLHRNLAGLRSDPEQQERLEARILQQLINAQLSDQVLSEENVQPILGRAGIASSTQLVSDILDTQSTNEILIAEMDPQCNTSSGLGVDLEAGQKTLYDVLLNPRFGIDYAVVPTLFGVDLLPARSDMSALETILAQPEEMRREYRLDDALRRAKGSAEYPIQKQAIQRYRCVLIDPPPLLGQLVMNSMVGSDYIVAVLDMGAYSINSLKDLEARLHLVEQIQHPDLGGHQVALGGIVCNKYNQQEGYLDQCVTAEESVRQRYGATVFETIIPQNARIFDAPSFKRPVQYNDPKNGTTKNATAAYAALARECIQRFALSEEVIRR